MNDPSAVTVRFAPSPTGYLHIGNARTALFNFLYARQHGGGFVLRLDDTDRARSRADYAEAITLDLAWLGAVPERTVRQSDRLALYDSAAERLKRAGRLYPCFETPEELDRRRRIAAARGLPPVYDRAALRLDPAERDRLEAAGRRPHWRFLLDDAPGEGAAVAWRDLFHGDQAIDPRTLSDPVLIREDGTYLYTLPSVVDDIDLAVSHVIRGDDHLTNTAVQIRLFEALGAAAPIFGHHNLLIDAAGEGLSKRTGALSLAGLRRDGYEPLAVAAFAVLIGSAEPVAPVADLDELATCFAPEKVSHAAARFDPAELAGLNARLVHAMDFETVRDRLAALGIGGGAAFWEAVRANCARVADAAEWWPVVSGTVEPAPMPAEDAAFLAEAAAALPPEPWDATTWRAWTDALKSGGRKGRALFMPLRLALTGRAHGPEMAALLPLIGRSNTLARLSAPRPRP